MQAARHTVADKQPSSSGTLGPCFSSEVPSEPIVTPSRIERSPKIPPHATPDPLKVSHVHFIISLSWRFLDSLPSNPYVLLGQDPS